jgi:hypothetical protein
MRQSKGTFKIWDPHVGNWWLFWWLLICSIQIPAKTSDSLLPFSWLLFISFKWMPRQYHEIGDKLESSITIHKYKWTANVNLITQQ